MLPTMTESLPASPSMAVFCDFENVAIGCRESGYDNFDIELVLERLLHKGKIVVKKAYSDWDRYKTAKRGMHEASFELIEIPHVSYSGKNSADIRLVVDALDLCYTKAHVDTFVIVSGDSDFSPLVSKLRENDKTVIGVGVKNSSSDLLVENCDEFIYYDDLFREHQRETKRALKSAKADKAFEPQRDPAGKRSGEKEDALELVLETVEALLKDREGHLFGSMVKQVIKRRRPHFEESYYGYRTFSDLLVDADERGLLVVKKDEKSGGYIIEGFGPNA